MRSREQVVALRAQHEAIRNQKPRNRKANG